MIIKDPALFREMGDGFEQVYGFVVVQRDILAAGEIDSSDEPRDEVTLEKIP